jgi:hypothetical protein
MPDRFDPQTLAAFADTDEIEIITAASPDAPRHRTVIWVVADAEGRVLIRSYLGPGARWFREAILHPAVTVHVSGRAIDATALVATDEGRIAACSRGYREKYPDDPATDQMVSEAVLSTTLELVPR